MEELELKHCFLWGREIASVSLKRLTLFKCTFADEEEELSVDAPNLVFLRCIAPWCLVPVFKNFDVLVTGSIIIDDSLLSPEFRKDQDDDDEFSQTSDDDDDDDNSCLASEDSNLFMGDYSHISDDFCDKFSDDIKDNYDYGSDINSDSDPYKYSEVANGYENKQFGNFDDGHYHTEGNKYHGCSANHVLNDYKELGGQNVLHSLSNAQSLELLGHSGEGLDGKISTPHQ